MKNSLLIRKVNQTCHQLIKKNVGIGTPILINSFPKSGTHLLHQIFLNNPPHLSDYNTFIASMPSFAQMERSRNKTLKMVNNIIGGELIRAHLFYNSDVGSLLNKKKVIHYFIYRDPRDVVISEANYLYDMNKWHRLHKYFKKFPSLDDRIMFSIKGNDFCKTPLDYPNVVERFHRYKGWLLSENVFPVKYEELVSGNRDTHIKNIMNYYINQSAEQKNINEMVSKGISNINPTKSHTFREGGKQKWKKYFNDEHKLIFKKIGGELLIELDYEKDLNW